MELFVEREFYLKNSGKKSETYFVDSEDDLKLYFLSDSVRQEHACLHVLGPEHPLVCAILLDGKKVSVQFREGIVELQKKEVESKRRWWFSINGTEFCWKQELGLVNNRKLLYPGKPSDCEDRQIAMFEPQQGDNDGTLQVYSESLNWCVDIQTIVATLSAILWSTKVEMRTQTCRVQ